MRVCGQAPIGVSDLSAESEALSTAPHATSAKSPCDCREDRAEERRAYDRFFSPKGPAEADHRHLVRTVSNDGHPPFLVYHYTSQAGFEQAIYHHNVLGQTGENGSWGGKGLYVGFDPLTWRRFGNRPRLLVFELKPGTRVLDFRDPEVFAAFSHVSPQFFDAVAQNLGVDAVIESHWGEHLEMVVRRPDCLVTRPAQAGFWAYYEAICGQEHVAFADLCRVARAFNVEHDTLLHHDPNGEQWAKKGIAEIARSEKLVFDTLPSPRELHEAFSRILSAAALDALKTRSVHEYRERLARIDASDYRLGTHLDRVSPLRAHGVDVTDEVRRALHAELEQSKSLEAFDDFLQEIVRNDAAEAERVAAAEGSSSAEAHHASLLARCASKHGSDADLDRLRLRRELRRIARREQTYASGSPWPWPESLDRLLPGVMQSELEDAFVFLSADRDAPAYQRAMAVVAKLKQDEAGGLDAVARLLSKLRFVSRQGNPIDLLSDSTWGSAYRKELEEQLLAEGVFSSVAELRILRAKAGRTARGRAA